MEIPEIKQRLTIAQVLSRYNLKPDRNHRLHCPFHPDKTPAKLAGVPENQYLDLF
jgi:DNA primase